MLTVLSIAYALAPVRPDTAGGAEQVLLALDRTLTAAGHHSIVVAASGSQVAGRLSATPPLPESFTETARRQAERRQRWRIEEALRRFPVDVVHCHGLDFLDHLPATNVPALVTLHLPAECYPPEVLRRPMTWFNCVSSSQRRQFMELPAMLPEIDNGVPIAALSARHARRKFALALGRICPEKGFHLALDAASMAGVPLLIGGRVFPYEAHERYFADEIVPRLGNGARFLGPLDFARKRRLLSAARCLLAPSLVAETSSLVAMEALACGTPVVAFRAGALPEIVEHGITGYLVDDVRGMADAIAKVGALDPSHCRRVARERFAEERMAAQYLATYRRLASQ